MVLPHRHKSNFVSSNHFRFLPARDFVDPSVGNCPGPYKTSLSLEWPNSPIWLVHCPTRTELRRLTTSEGWGDFEKFVQLSFLFESFWSLCFFLRSGNELLRIFKCHVTRYTFSREMHCFNFFRKFVYYLLFAPIFSSRHVDVSDNFS